MDKSNKYYKQVQLLLKVLPFVAKQDCFALKGGTAINLFVRDFPRLSVDIDLVYLPMKNRVEALSEIKSALSQIKQDLLSNFQDMSVVESFLSSGDALRLVITSNGVQIKVELSPVLRGTVFEPEVTPVCEAVEDEFGYAEINMVSLPDLYAGKICAALDRQHPRDLFDVRQLLDNEGLRPDIRTALLVYISSHNRPISELLSPKFKDIGELYANEFANMAEHDTPLELLEKTRIELVELIHSELSDSDKQFLMSFKELKPNWELLGVSGISDLPAIRWKQLNLSKMKPEKHAEACEKLRHTLKLEP